VAFTTPGAPADARTTDGGGADGGLRALIDAGVLLAEPIVYEDFLPRSAAGIFRSNLAGEGTRHDDLAAPEYDLGRLSDVLGMPVRDPMDLYAAQRDASLHVAAEQLGVPVDLPSTEEAR
jgi:uncharacterized glyoxalase superfamily metalloenzyme YdcJ